MTITVYSKPNCMQCKMVKKWLTEHEIPFTTIDITDDEDSITQLKEFGYKTVPVTFIDDYSFVGFDVNGLRQAEVLYHGN